MHDWKWEQKWVQAGRPSDHDYETGKVKHRVAICAMACMGMVMGYGNDRIWTNWEGIWRTTCGLFRDLGGICDTLASMCVLLFSRLPLLAFSAV